MDIETYIVFDTFSKTYQLLPDSWAESKILCLVEYT